MDVSGSKYGFEPSALHSSEKCGETPKIKHFHRKSKEWFLGCFPAGLKRLAAAVDWALQNLKHKQTSKNAGPKSTSGQ